MTTNLFRHLSVAKGSKRPSPHVERLSGLVIWLSLEHFWRLTARGYARRTVGLL